ncbi:LytTR family transcriptional regulator DNA-binding domain-containing protein [uncultured Prevotella sp.]|uniref:LytTR family transcriptional regulator DNA-binding domain-containing protein n=1 Tax=uncultured Prevotella sp. TaxID=159272 RepID=UPI00343E7B66
MQLKNNFFIRVGKSLIVNKKYIYVINISTQELLLSGSRLSVEFKLRASKDALKELKDQIELETTLEQEKNVTTTGADREKKKNNNVFK